MDDILQWLSQYPLALNIIGILITTAMILVIGIYLTAFIQGREISLWPPKIGKKSDNSKKENTKNKALNLSEKDSTATHPKLDTLSGIELKRPNISIEDIAIKPEAYNDCKNLNLSTNHLTKFILGEIESHPLMFLAPFSSTPLIYFQYVLLISWNGDQVFAERILNREKTYPTNDTWYSCVSLYRQATALPYRVGTQIELLPTKEIERSIKFYRKLSNRMKVLINLLQENNVSVRQNITDFDILIDEAETALFRGDTRTCVVRMESFLSTIHKMLLIYTPSTISLPSSENTFQEKTNSLSKTTKKDAISILVAEDSFFDAESIKSRFARAGYNNVLFYSTIDDVLQAMVNKDFDLLITDGSFEGDKTIGTEIAIAAKQISQKTKVVLMSRFPDIGVMVQKELPFVTFMNKSTLENTEAFMKFINKILDDKN